MFRMNNKIHQLVRLNWLPSNLLPRVLSYLAPETRLTTVLNLCQDCFDFTHPDETFHTWQLCLPFVQVVWKSKKFSISKWLKLTRFDHFYLTIILTRKATLIEKNGDAVFTEFFQDFRSWFPRHQLLLAYHEIVWSSMLSYRDFPNPFTPRNSFKNMF